MVPSMSIYRRVHSDNLPSFVTTNVNERRSIFTSSSTCELLIRIIFEVRTETSFKLLAFTIMPDHLHIIVVPSETGVSRIVQLIKGRFARAHNELTGRAGAVWQSRYHERTLRNERSLLSAIEYVHYNPVAARLVREANSYRWSSVNGCYTTDIEQYLGQAKA